MSVSCSFVLPLILRTLDGKGFSLVEIVTSCPTNWGMEALEALDFLEDKMFAEFPLGVIRDKSKEGK